LRNSDLELGIFQVFSCLEAVSRIGMAAPGWDEIPMDSSYIYKVPDKE